MNMEHTRAANSGSAPEQSEDVGEGVYEALLAALGQPSSRGDRWAIYHGDCVQLLRTLPSTSVPLTVTSPPYNIGKEYEKILSLDEYLDWSETWIAEIHRATTVDGAFWLNLGYVSIDGRAKAIPLPYLIWDRVPFYMMQEVVWNYGAGVAARKYFSPRNEKFIWYVKDPEAYTFNLDDVRDPDVKYPNQMKNGKLRCNPLGKNPTDVWQIPKVTSGAKRSSAERTPHPAQFPIALVERAVRTSSAMGQVVLDPFVGSGSLLEATLRSGRYGIGFELREDYVTLAAERLRRATAQLPLL